MGRCVFRSLQCKHKPAQPFCQRSNNRKAARRMVDLRADKCSAPKIGCRPTIRGGKRIAPGASPGLDRKAARSPGGATEKCCEQMPFAPAGAPSIQYPIRGLAPPATIFWPLRGLARGLERSFATVNRPMCARKGASSKLASSVDIFDQSISKPSQLVPSGWIAKLQAEVS